MQELQNAIQEQLSALLVDPSPVVKRSILHNISALCIFLGKQRTNDVLLSHMITYLNDRDWVLRFAFFDSIVEVAACAGGRSLEDYILPLMIQALSGKPIQPPVRCFVYFRSNQSWKRLLLQEFLPPSAACANWVSSRRCASGNC